MSIPPRPLAVAAALCAALTSLPSAGSAQAPGERPPADAEFKEQVKRLQESRTPAGKLKALKWVEKHSAAGNARLATPVLEHCIRKDPDARVRAEAIACRALIAKERREPCPLLIVEAILDPDVYVSQAADACAGLFKRYAPGCIEVLLRCARSENFRVRQACVSLLAQAGGKEKRVVAALESATHDKVFSVRHNARCALFRATDDLEAYLAYLVRLQENPDGVLGAVDRQTEAGKRELTTRNLALIASALLILEWAEKRADDLAPALLRLLASASPELRRGAARLVGASAAQIDKKGPPFQAEQAAWKRMLFPQQTPTKTDKPLQKSRVAMRLDKLNVAGRLRELRQNDPDPAVRSAARFALEQLARGQGKKGPGNGP